jgi:Na+:H+ antiporter, NhaA family
VGGLWRYAAIRPGDAGVTLTSVDLSAEAQLVTLSGGLALVVGKPLGVVGATWLAVRMGLCRLAPGVSWRGVCLVGLLAGIGFTMSIFIAMLAFTNPRLLNAAKLGVLLASLAAATLGLVWGAAYAGLLRRMPTRAQNER